MNGDLRRALIKVVLGVVILAGAFGYRTVVGDEPPAPDEVERVPLKEAPPWADFPALTAEMPGDATPLSAHEPKVAFVYTPSDCSPYLEEMEAWERVVKTYPELRLFGVLQVESAKLGRRFAHTYPDPFPTRIDTTAWFQQAAGLQQTPVLIFEKPDGTRHIVAPRTDRTDVGRQQLLENLFPFWTSDASPVRERTPSLFSASVV